MNKYNCISVVVPTRNSIRTIAGCLESVWGQNLGAYSCELIVVDNFSTDGTAEYLLSVEASHSLLYYSLGPERSEQRNFGFMKSSSDIVAYIDSDMYLTPDLLRLVLDAFNIRDIDAIKVPEIIFGGSLLNSARRFERMLYSDTLIDSPRFIKKSILHAVGGFMAGIPGSEDWEFDSRLIAAGANFYFLNTSLLCPVGYLKDYKATYKLEGLIHDEGDITLNAFLSKKSYYAEADRFIFNHFKTLASPMFEVFSLSYRLRLIFSRSNLLKYNIHYIYVPVIMFYRVFHLIKVKLFTY